MDRYVVVDLETTGNTSKYGNDKITQFAAVVIEDGEITEVFSTFVNPQKPIPPFITELTGINDEMVQSAPLFQEIVPKVRSLLEGSSFVAHNVYFDWGFLQEEMAVAGYNPLSCPVIDTVELARFLLPTSDSYKLADLAKAFEIIHEHPHRADSDAEVTAKLFLKLLDKMSSFPLATLQSLYELSRNFKSDSGEIIASLIMEKLESNETSEAYDIFRNIALRKKSYTVSFDEEHISFEQFEKHIDDHLRSVLPAYEVRDGQRMMMKEVYASFINNKISFIESGTGTGKTLAYLLPSMFYAKKAEKPVVISTHTVQLQQQIMDKEIPLLKKILPFSFEVALMKGRKHYLCLNKFEHAMQEEDTNYDSVLTKAKILVWLLQTETGDVDELNLPTGGKILWQRICCDRNSQTGNRNVWNSRCFYEHAKHRVYFADLIVTNHVMLFQDSSNEDSIFSDYEYIVLDEAHQIEAAASHALGEQFSCLSFQLLLSRLGTLDTDGVLHHLYEIMDNHHIASITQFREIDERLRTIKFESDELFRMLRSFIFDRNQKKNISQNIKIQYKYDAVHEKGKLWSAITESAYRLDTLLQSVHNGFMQLIDKVRNQLGGYVIGQEFTSLSDSLSGMKQALLSLLVKEQVDGVTWMETDTKGSLHSTILFKQPTDVSSILEQMFFSKRKSVVLTSATLTVNGTFDYVKKVLGLTKRPTSTLVVPSPFRYDTQVKMMIPTTVPNIKSVSKQEYVTSITEHIASIATAMRGRMLVLFTSYDMLRETYNLVKEMEVLGDYALLAQGVNGMNRMRMTKNFQTFDKAILFGTSSFWEGIDIPGEALSCLVMVRLPFAPPDSPIMAAKAKKLIQMGKSPFQELSLPQAIIRFKQGFGRLIRTKDDNGIFFVLDRRIKSTYYGKQFIESIPPVPIYEETIEELLHRLC
ncbi:ATP-dependent DNA helicase DinG [Ectobacillus polymachus]|uniref:ATP-dependent DNA helicase DinG n=1 Tax=Ectobacillus polymachus TaxID=1508806 RepID=UPI003A8A9082